MKNLVVLAIFSAALAHGQLTRNTPVPDLFGESDVVFSGRAVSVNPKAPPTNDANGMAAPRDWTVVFSVSSSYKEAASGSVLELLIPNRSALWGAPGAPGMQFLVFARKKASVLTLVDDQAMLVFFNVPTPRAGAPSGLAQLESDIVSVGTGHGAQASAALEMLFRFPVLTEKSVGALRSFNPQGHDDWNFLRMELVARQGSANDVGQLLEAAVGRDEPAIPDSSHVFEIISQNVGTSNLTVLEQLSNSNFPPFRFAAMDAIRRLADPQSIPFLTGKLHASDTNVSYVALMTLSEITGKHEFATDMASFERSPEQFIRRWEDASASSSSTPK